MWAGAGAAAGAGADSLSRSRAGCGSSPATREGVRFAIEEMTERKLLVFREPS